MTPISYWQQRWVASISLLCSDTWRDLSIRWRRRQFMLGFTEPSAVLSSRQQSMGLILVNQVVECSSLTACWRVFFLAQRGMSRCEKTSLSKSSDAIALLLWCCFLFVWSLSICVLDLEVTLHCEFAGKGILAKANESQREDSEVSSNSITLIVGMCWNVSIGNTTRDSWLESASTCWMLNPLLLIMMNLW